MADDAANWRRIPEELISEGRLELVDELFAEDYVEHAAVPPGITPDREGVRAFFTALRAAFPDLRYEVLSQFQDGDTHVGHIRATGTMTGSFAGMPPSNKAATWEEMHIGRMANGQVLEHWGVVDQLSMLIQLGFVPPMGG